jgi:23S rRNA pseudouridine1911/1915/1917 synthase
VNGRPGSASSSTATCEFVVPGDAAGTRLDRFAARMLDVSRAEVQRWIQSGRVTVDGIVGVRSSTLRPGARVVVRPDLPAPTAVTPDPAVKFDVLFVDEDIVVVNKPPGLVVHPAPGHAGRTLVNGLLALGLFRRDAFGTDEPTADNVRPGLVHRLDKGTSGVMVVARNALAREALKVQFQQHSIDRAYVAIVVGVAASRTISTLHGRDPRNRLRFTSRVPRGKRAVTHVRALEALDGATLVECTLETGRTHQIRVHLSEGGTPVLGDPLYGKTARSPHVAKIAAHLGHQALHARRLGFLHPRTGVRVDFDAAPPQDFMEALERLRRPDSVA